MSDAEDATAVLQAFIAECKGGSVAEAAGMAAGDEWLGVEVKSALPAAPQAWRVGSLADVQNCLPPPASKGKTKKQPPTVTAIIARDKRLLRLPMQLPASTLQSGKLVAAPEMAKECSARTRANTNVSARKLQWPWG